MTRNAPATAHINLRASHEQKALIDRAASCLGKSRTEFILDTTREAAERVLLDRRLYLLDAERFAAFEAALAGPAEPSAALRKTMKTPPPWNEE